MKNFGVILSEAKDLCINRKILRFTQNDIKIIKGRKKNMKHRFKTQGVCASYIDFEVDNDIVHNVKFHGGCRGNRQAVAILVEGKHVNDVIRLLRGIDCQNGTSCPDQFAQALEALQK